jgi:hypothetical protein
LVAAYRPTSFIAVVTAPIIVVIATTVISSLAITVCFKTFHSLFCHLLYLNLLPGTSSLALICLIRYFTIANLISSYQWVLHSYFGVVIDS